MCSRWFTMCSALCVALWIAGAAAQQNFPQKPVRIIVPYPPGGGTDMIARLVAQHVSEQWRQPVTVVNRGGGAGNIGAEVVAGAPPDGTTLMFASGGPLVINSYLFKSLAYDPAKFAPVTLVVTVPNVLSVRSTLPLNSVRELIEYARQNPGKLTYASQGSGSTGHLAMELFLQMAGIKAVHVPYKGGAQAQADLQGGQVDALFDGMLSTTPSVKTGRIKMLAIASRNRLQSLPDLPTVSETVPGYLADSWLATVAPPNTPEAITEQVSRAIAHSLQLPDVRKRIAELYSEIVGSTPAEAAAFFAQERERWRKVIQLAGVSVD